MKNTIIRFAFFCSFAGCIFSACNFSSDNLIVSESDYSAKIIGTWEGTVGDLKEVMVIKSDCTFVCRVRPLGFIANTLSQSLPGTIYGKWLLKGAKIDMEITGEKNERVENSLTSSLIVGFRENSLILKSSGGDSTVFNRMSN